MTLGAGSWSSTSMASSATTIAATHVVHSKIYPRNKTYRAFHLATDNLSRWLAANEAPDTDVILVGHSMGGLLAADLVLMPDRTSRSKEARKHRLLGTVNLDIPFLGVQNRVVLAGLLSPLRSKSEPLQMLQASASATVLSPPQHDSPSSAVVNSSSTDLHSPTTITANSFNPDHTSDPKFSLPFANVVRTTSRPWKQSFMHFVQKHRDHWLFHASFRHWRAHFEFGSCLLDARRLKMRYERLRELAAADPPTTPRPVPSTTLHRVNFVQFYTACYKGRSGQGLVESVQDTTLGSRESSLSSSPAIVAGRSGTFSVVPLPAEEDQLFFCKLAHQEGGQLQTQWVKIMMMTNDEIVAHTALFKPGPHYGRLVEEVSAEMTKWVREAFPDAGTFPPL